MPDSSSPFEVTTVGEVMLRLSVPAGTRLEIASSLAVTPGGAESNVMAVLARLKRRCGLVTALPDTSLGRLATTHLRMAGVDMGGVVWCKTGRIGTYFVEFAAPPHPIHVTYDRADSCAAHLSADQIDWQYLLKTRLLHITGITPALSASCRDLTTEMITRAKSANVAISFDVNYRQKLWTTEEAAEVMSSMIQGVDLLFCKEADARRLFGCTGTLSDVIGSLVDRSGARQVVVTSGDQGVTAWDGSQLLHEPAIPVQIVDRLGAGDALAAGVLHGWLNSNLAQGLRYGVGLASLALSQHGDVVVTTLDELNALVANLHGNSQNGERLLR
ncbi:MAG: sugar kinase [Chloroflexota bacterium]